jgi:hypothetical protein
LAVALAGVTSVLDANRFKSYLADSQIYDQLVAFAADRLDKAAETDATFRTLTKDIKAELTGAYVKGKIEPLLDDTFAYLNGQSEKIPGISFGDISAKLKKRNYLFGVLFQAYDLSAYLEKPQTLDQATAENIRANYSLVVTTLPQVLWAAGAVLLLFVALLAEKGKRIRSAGKAIFIPAVTGLVLALIILVGLQYLKLPTTVPELLQAPLQSLITAVAGQVMGYQAWAYLALAVLGFALFKGPALASKFLKKEPATGPAAK